MHGSYVMHSVYTYVCMYDVMNYYQILVRSSSRWPNGNSHINVVAYLELLGVQRDDVIGATPPRASLPQVLDPVASCKGWQQ